MLKIPEGSTLPKDFYEQESNCCLPFCLFALRHKGYPPLLKLQHVKACDAFKTADARKALIRMLELATKTTGYEERIAEACDLSVTSSVYARTTNREDDMRREMRKYFPKEDPEPAFVALAKIACQLASESFVIGEDGFVTVDFDSVELP